MKRKELKRLVIPLPLVAELDAIYARIPAVECRGKCVDCCSPVGDLMSKLEFDRITRAAGKKPNGMADLRAGKHCNMLVDGRCSVYAIRPTICRLWGVDKKMHCPFGCKGSGALPTKRGEEFLIAVGALSHYKIVRDARRG